MQPTVEDFGGRTLPNGRARGPADVVESVQTFRGRMPVAEGGRSVVASLLGLGVGASAGQYGPWYTWVQRSVLPSHE